MSNVTNLIISTCGTGDGEQVANWLWARYSGVKMRDLYEHDMEQHEESPEAIGGTKCLEADIRIGAFNYLDLDEFSIALDEITFLHRSEVQVFIQEQGEQRFRFFYATGSRCDKD